MDVRLASKESAAWRGSRRICGVVLIAAGALVAGCHVAPPAEFGAAMQRAVVMYFEGSGEAGADHLQTGVAAGFKDAGWKGRFHVMDWTTGGGLVRDHASTVEYKREQARRAAQEIVHAIDGGQAVVLIGFSAGTAVAVFALEALPEGCQVDSVLLLSSSLSRHYDLTAALRHVDGSVLVSCSERDPVLRGGVAILGTADRVFGSAGTAAGLSGFDYPTSPTIETYQLYYKVRRVPYLPIFARVGNDGGHYGPTSREFTAEVTAPLVIANVEWRRPFPGAPRSQPPIAAGALPQGR